MQGILTQAQIFMMRHAGSTRQHIGHIMYGRYQQWHDA